MAFKWRKVGGDRPFGYDGIPGMDPAANWLLGPGKSAYLPGDYEDPMIPTLFSLQLPDTQSPPDEFEKIFGRNYSSGVGAWPVRKSDLDDLAHRDPSSKIFKFLRRFQFSLKLSTPHTQSPHLPAQFSELPNPPPAPPSGGWPDDTVVMAVIDDGICFAHEAFQDADEKTRIQYWWQQDGPEPDEIPTVPFGREIGKNAFETGAETRDGIDDFMMNGNMDETDIYRAAGVVDFSLGRRSSAALRRSHGTHVLDVAAGYRRDDEENTKRPIIAVQLPTDVVEKSSGAELEFHVVKAVEYILHRARKLKPEGSKLPVVITMSYGFIAGPHDGTTALEVALKQSLEDYGDEAAQMVLSAGNSHLSRCHAEFTIESAVNPVELEWMVLPDDRTSSFLEIWLPYDSTVLPPADGSPVVDDRIEVSVVAPNGQESGFVPGVQGDPERFALNGSTAEIDAAAEIKYAFVTGETMRGMFRITLSPTEHLAGEPGGWAGHALAPAGVWRVRVRRNTLASDAVVNAWIQRDDTIYGFPPRGRQSYFVSACYDRFDAQGRRTVEDKDSNQNCAIRRHALLSAIATGERVVVAGSYKLREKDIVNYSAGEPITPKQDQIPQPPVRRKPDALMIGEDSRVHRGILAAGTRSGSVTRMGGTSVAAPGLARWLAADAGMGAGAGRDLVRAGAELDQGPGGPFESAPPLDADRGGWGRIESKPRRIDIERFDE